MVRKRSRVQFPSLARHREYFLISTHREENVDSPEKLDNLLLSLNSICSKYRFPIIFSTHPRTKARLKASKVKVNKLVKFIKPLGLTDYIKLQISSLCVLSDSGTISEESSLLGFSALMLRDAHERPESMDEASVVMAGVNKDHVLRSLDLVIKHHKQGKKLKKVEDYDVDNVSVKVVRIILSYIPYVNRVVWHKT